MKVAYVIFATVAMIVAVIVVTINYVINILIGREI